MIRFLAVCVALAVVENACADDKKKPDKLNDQEIASGELMLFDQETTYGWTIEGESGVKDGWMVLGGEKATTAKCTTAFPTSFVKCELVYDDNLPKTRLPRISMTKENKGLIPPSDGVTGYATGGQLCRMIIEVPAGASIRLGRVSAKPAAEIPLFNGKNLGGWSINKADPKRMASKWQVTKEGELSLKNGPGDLVSEKEFDNFVLQLECKTLGEALNSGVFFRNIPGQYQNGYEAQIQNSYKEGDRTKPIDFGTGAIYRRTPARKVVSNDNEWFTMTVVAEGKHIATWVNGYQTVDWTDDRPADDNPRKGYRAAKGPISLQGHDKTTDLLFRNIRIAELPVEKKRSDCNPEVARLDPPYKKLNGKVWRLPLQNQLTPSFRVSSRVHPLWWHRTTHLRTQSVLSSPSPCSRLTPGLRRPWPLHRGNGA